MNIHLRSSETPDVGRRDVEIVERKGKGHPDTICDQAMEQVSLALCRLYMERYGAILHHNCDKGMLVAGGVERRFGGGKVLEPMRLVIGDRAALGPRLGKDELTGAAVAAAKSWIRSSLRHVDPDLHVKYQSELHCGSHQLAAIFHERDSGVLGANDTSAAVGYAPLTETERLVLEAERFLNGEELKARFPFTGEDVKVMGVRTARELSLTAAMPFIDSVIESESQYYEAKDLVRDALHSHLAGKLQQLDSISISFNALDRPGAGLDGMYLSVLGTSAEDADSGEVGRGNRVNGLIPFCRPGGNEAAAGKNPVSHVGKIYNVLSFRLAERLHSEIPGIEAATVWLCSRIGDRVNAPRTVAIDACLAPGCAPADVEEPAARLIAGELERLPAFCQELAAGKHEIC